MQSSSKRLFCTNTKLVQNGWQPYADMLSSNNKLKFETEMNAHHPDLSLSVPSVLYPFVSELNLDNLRSYRTNRMRQALINMNCDVGIFFDPTNIRYITDVPNFNIWTKAFPHRYVVLSADERDPMLLFDFKASEHVGLLIRDDLTECDKLKIFTSMSPVAYMHMGTTGYKNQSNLMLSDLKIKLNEFLNIKHPNVRVCVDTLRPIHFTAQSNFEWIDGWEQIERARLQKSNDEYILLKLVNEIGNIASHRIKKALEENIENNERITDNQLFAILQSTNIEYGGEYIESRLLASGQKSNPWWQESSNHEVDQNTAFSFDTDMIGPFGYLADFSRSFWTGHGIERKADKKKYAEYKDLYNYALEQLEHNIELIKDGASYKEIQSKLYDVPPQFYQQRYSMAIHGCGMSHEYPIICQQDDIEWTNDDCVQSGQSLSVESYIGEVGGAMGLKLEQQLFVHKDHTEILSNFPFEDL